MTDNTEHYTSEIAKRFRGFLPVIVDVETAGFNPVTDALLEVSAVTLCMSNEGELIPENSFDYHIEPFPGSNIEQAALDFTGIDLSNRAKETSEEKSALNELFQHIRKAVKEHDCNRAILVGHNANFDLSFINIASERCELKRNPFHPFSCFDTATLAGLAFGHTVLAKSCEIAGIEFSNKAAHSAAYDAEKTAELFCLIVNKWKYMGGWPLS